MVNKKNIIVLMLAFLSMVCVSAEPVEGLWKSIDEKTNKITGIWNLYVKDGTLYGEMKVTAGYKLSEKAAGCKANYPEFPVKGSVNEMLLVGTPFIYGLKKDSSTYWKNGRIINPANGKWYWCYINFIKADGATYNVDTLKVRGEISWGLGRNQYWQRSSQAEVDALIKEQSK